MSVRFKLFLSHFLAVLLVSGSIGTYFYRCAAESVMNGLKERLAASAALISQTLNADDIRDIRQPSDIAKPSYIANLHALRALRGMNPDIAFLYVMRQEGEKFYFVLDSDESPKQAPPGREYLQALPNLIKGFTSVTVDDAINTDEWGSFLSGYAPLKNGAGRYLIGIDMRADKVRSKLRNLVISGIVSLLASLLLAFAFANYMARRFMIPIRLATDRCYGITAGKFNEQIELRNYDEFDNLIGALNSMSNALDAAEKKKREAFEALNQSRNELEIRVRQRTSDLQEVNAQLSHEIAERLLAQKALQEAAATDPLTRLFNRRVMIDFMEQEAKRNNRNHAPFSLIMADLDHFKSINDAEGHDAGDSILIETGVRMKSMLRSVDSVSRWGGEEFMMLLPDTNLEGARIAAEKIMRRIGNAPYYIAGREIAVSASFGVAEFNPDSDIAQLVQSVDRALYQAKNLGRNRVETAPDSQ